MLNIVFTNSYKCEKCMDEIEEIQDLDKIKKEVKKTIGLLWYNV